MGAVGGEAEAGVTAFVGGCPMIREDKSVELGIGLG